MVCCVRPYWFSFLETKTAYRDRTCLIGGKRFTSPFYLVYQAVLIVAHTNN
nr:MAG TPA: hypothetical protein [Caudoviricetes sp.]